MTMYKHHAPSTTSLSDNDDGDHAVYAGQDDDDRTVVPAQWSTKRPLVSKPTRAPRRHSPIARLPAEILIHIFKHLHSPRDLYSSLRVSRTWCECSVELLWHKPAFTKFPTLEKMARHLAAPDQTFTYASFIRRLNFLSLSKDIKDDILSILAQCERLERLTLVNCELITGETLSRVLPHFPNLVAIDLSGVTNVSNEAIVGLATAAKRLQGINLAGCKNVSDEGILALANNCPLLRRVKLSGLALITDEPISALAKSCPLLLEVDLNHCSLVTDISIRDIWTYSTHMREMRLSHCPGLTDAAFPAPIRKDQAEQQEARNAFPSSNKDLDDLPPLIISRTFEHLRMLDLTACALVTDDAVEGIISHAPKIRNLVLSKCGLLTDRSVENICKLGRYLHYLHLGHAVKITDGSVRTLARSCTRLRYIDFANCVLLTDMSVFELSALPKLRRVGLVRVNNLTDEAIYALADRHATLERIHLSYCDQISVMAIHFLLQKLHKLTHLSLTGVPAFRQPELQQFCREPPSEFSSTQQSTFCVYSGKGVAQLRAFLIELFDHITEMNCTDDTEYEDEDEYDAEAYHEEDTPEPEGDGADDDEDETFSTSRRMFINLPITARTNRRFMVNPNQDESAPRDPPSRTATLPPSSEGTPDAQSSANLHMATSRLNAQIMAAAASSAGAGSSRRARAPAPTSVAHRSVADMLPIVENSHSPPPSDVASNRSAGTNRSNGATFFRTYQEGNASSRNSGALTPDLNFAEIGHGRYGQAGPSTPQPPSHHLRRGQEQHPHHRPPFIEVERAGDPGPSSSAHTWANSGDSDQDAVLIPSSNSHPNATTAQTEPGSSVVWPYREPISPTSTPSVPDPIQSAPGNGVVDGRGRSVKRSLRNTLNVAEQYATSFLFGRSPTRATHDESAPSHNGSKGH